MRKCEGCEGVSGVCEGCDGCVRRCDGCVRGVRDVSSLRLEQRSQ